MVVRPNQDEDRVMSVLFNEAHRALQDEFGTRRMADKIEEIACHDFVDENEKAFIESRDMVFIATVDTGGCPTVSYKGADPGFIRVVDEKTLIFPSDDGNGPGIRMSELPLMGDR